MKTIRAEIRVKISSAYFIFIFSAAVLFTEFLLFFFFFELFYLKSSRFRFGIQGHFVKTKTFCLSFRQTVGYAVQTQRQLQFNATEDRLLAIIKLYKKHQKNSHRRTKWPHRDIINRPRTPRDSSFENLFRTFKYWNCGSGGKRPHRLRQSLIREDSVFRVKCPSKPSLKHRTLSQGTNLLSCRGKNTCSEGYISAEPTYINGNSMERHCAWTLLSLANDKSLFYAHRTSAIVK